jgi:GDPmannose 4,6-dehydratase
MEQQVALITGVTGMDGSHLADLLLDSGYQVIGLKRRTSTENTWRIDHLRGNSNFSIIEGDITDYYCMFSIIDKYKPDFIYNTAAQSHVATSFTQPQLTWDITGQGAMNVLQACVDAARRSRLYHPRFLQCSSSEMFGSNYNVEVYKDCVQFSDKIISENMLGANKHRKYQDETTALAPNSPYGIAKLAAHQYTRLCREAYGTFACSSICFNHSGERRTETFILRKVSKWIGQYIANGGADDYLYMGNLKSMRDFGYAPDYVRAMQLMMESNTPDDFVICTERSYTMEEAVKMAFEVVNLDWTDFVKIDKSLFRDREVEFLEGRAKKIRDKLDWTPTTTLKEMLNIMVAADIERAK